MPKDPATMTGEDLASPAAHEDVPLPAASEDEVLDQTARLAREGRRELEADPLEQKPRGD